ncbi:hypothetical protein AUJ17_03205 [Candidatus Micrarchaeota archaeon CG1_02_47_40]|nr:MAG: hypothetical protein AUJ17_03205 [Candidatus Micrarchaeota archaeon CG1_02_47_40]
MLPIMQLMVQAPKKEEEKRETFILYRELEGVSIPWKGKNGLQKHLDECIQQYEGSVKLAVYDLKVEKAQDGSISTKHGQMVYYISLKIPDEKIAGEIANNARKLYSKKHELFFYLPPSETYSRDFSGFHSYYAAGELCISLPVLFGGILDMLEREKVISTINQLLEGEKPRRR